MFSNKLMTFCLTIFLFAVACDSQDQISEHKKISIEALCALQVSDKGSGCAAVGEYLGNLVLAEARISYNDSLDVYTAQMTPKDTYDCKIIGILCDYQGEGDDSVKLSGQVYASAMAPAIGGQKIVFIKQAEME